jgi:hypothetical protein
MSLAVATLRPMTITIWDEKAAIWKSLPLEGSVFERLTLLGNGKDKDMELVLADGRRFRMGADDLRVTGCAGMTVQATSVGDLSLRIDYVGANLMIRHARVGTPVYHWSGPRETEEDFEQALREFLRADGREELLWAVSLELELVAAADD